MDTSDRMAAAVLELGEPHVREQASDYRWRCASTPAGAEGPPPKARPAKKPAAAEGGTKPKSDKEAPKN